MLVQTDRFGTPISKSLGNFSDALRTQRRQKAEEMAAKTTIKLVPPLVFFIFPSIGIVTVVAGSHLDHGKYWTHRGLMKMSSSSSQKLEEIQNG